MKKTWLKIFGVWIASILTSFLNYSFLYSNERTAYICNWIDPSYLAEFIVIGVVVCVCLCRQRLREFSSRVFNRESIIILIINVVFVLFVTIAGMMIGQYEVSWIAVLNRCLYFYAFVGITEEWIFRGFIVTQFKKVFKSKLLIIISSAVLFSLMHLPFYLMNTEIITFGGVIYRLLIPLLMGLVFTHIYLCNGNLFVVILLHGSYNMIESIAFDSWCYISYGIYWLFLIGYSVYGWRKRLKN